MVWRMVAESVGYLSQAFLDLQLQFKKVSGLGIYKSTHLGWIVIIFCMEQHAQIIVLELQLMLFY